MKKSYWLIFTLLIPFVRADDDVSIITRESDFCAKVMVNPEHCQNDGTCYHFYKEPIYPIELLKNNIEGEVQIKFDTNKDGCTINHQVINSDPSEEFGRAAIKALKKYRYSGSSEGLVETFTFRVQK